MQQLPRPLKPLADYPQFILWRLDTRNGKKIKFPIDPRTSLPFKKGSDWLRNSNLCVSADQALATLGKLTEGYGLGFVFKESDPFFFLDIDHCQKSDGQNRSPLALNLLQRLDGAAVEISQSGTGLHIFGQGHVPEHACKNTKLGIELYTARRFVALTGTDATGSTNIDCAAAMSKIVAEYFPPSARGNGSAEESTTEPDPDCNASEDDDELIGKMLAARSTRSAFGGGGGATFRQLWEADGEALEKHYPPQSDSQVFDNSSADLALCMHLAFWTGRNSERMDRLFRRSCLHRDKWDRPDYCKRTIHMATQRCTDVYSGHTKPLDELVNTVAYRTGSTFLGAHQQEKHFAGCVYISDRHRVFTPNGDLLKPEQFNATFGGHTFVIKPQEMTTRKTTCKAWEAFTESQIVTYRWAHGITFRPESPTGEIVTENDRWLVNVYVPAQGKRIAGDVAPFLDHVQRLLPQESDREIFLSYLAACVQRPGTKFQWCVVLQGAEGNGKTFFYHVLAYALGERYAHLPNAADLTNTFNAWIEQKLIIGIEELRTAGRQDVADALKAMITNKRIEIHGKGLDQRTGDNRANFIMFSNHKDAVLKNENDRRYCVFYTAQQEPGDLDRDGMNDDYFKEFYNWAESDGYSYIAEYLSKREITVNVMGRAPATSSTAEAFRSSLGVAEQTIQEAIDLEEWGFRGGLVSTKLARELLKTNGKKLSPQRVAGVLENLGYIKHSALLESEGKKRINGQMHRIYTKRGSLAAQLRTPQDVEDAWKRSHKELFQAFQPCSKYSEQPETP